MCGQMAVQSLLHGYLQICTDIVPLCTAVWSDLERKVVCLGIIMQRDREPQYLVLLVTTAVYSGTSQRSYGQAPCSSNANCEPPIW